MPTGTISQTASVGGLSIQSTVTRTETGQIGQEVPLPAANAGTLPTRTGDGAGTITLEAGHGIQAGDVIDIYWDGGLRYNVTVDTVVGNDITFDDTPAAAGDVLPAQDTAVTVSKQTTIDVDFDGDLLKMIVACSTYRSHIQFRDDTPTVLKAVELPAGEAWSWVSDQGITNPLAGDPVNDVKASNGDSSAAATLKIGALYDSA